MPKRRRADDTASIEAWLAEAQAEVSASMNIPAASARQKQTSATAPAWPRTAAAFAADRCETADKSSAESDNLIAATASVEILRLACALNLGSRQWRDQIDLALAAHLRQLQQTADDPEFDNSVRAFNSAAAARASSIGSSGLRCLRGLGRLDALHWALWSLGGRQAKRVRVPHPVRVAEVVSSALLATSEGASALARVARSMDAAARRALGIRESWLEAAANGGSGAAGSLGAADTDPGAAWQPGACTMLRYQRARLVEAAYHVGGGSSHGSGGGNAGGGGTGGDGSSGGAAVDASDAKVRRELQRWLFIGRDACARHMAFACPSRDGVRAIVGTARAAIVELGAGNGYWSKLVAKRVLIRRGATQTATTATATTSATQGVGARVRALDAVPPAAWRQSKAVRVEFGTAESLLEGSERTLLLCMPSPGEPGIAEEALRCFKGRRVVYIGEWGSGMTGACPDVLSPTGLAAHRALHV